VQFCRTNSEVPLVYTPTPFEPGMLMVLSLALETTALSSVRVRVRVTYDGMGEQQQLYGAICQPS